MSALRNAFTRLRHDARGAALPEFGFVAVPLLLFMVGTFDLGYQAYVRSVVAGQLDQSSRLISVQTANFTDVESKMVDQIKRVAGRANVDVQKQSFNAYSRINASEKLTNDVGNNGYIAGTGDCYEDLNRNNQWDASAGRANDGGGADDIVLYTVTVTYPRIVPLQNFLPGLGPNVTIVSKAMVRRQPFDTQPSPPVRCN